MAGVAEFARAVVVHGTTAVVADPHEIANVLGAEGIRYMLESAKDLPGRRFLHPPLLRAGHRHGDRRAPG